MNYPEKLWESAKQAYCPKITGESEKLCKLLFLQGMHAGRTLVVKSCQLDNDTMTKFNSDLSQQIEGSLSQIGHKPGTVDVGISRIKPAGPKVRAHINGEPLN